VVVAAVVLLAASYGGDLRYVVPNRAPSEVMESLNLNDRAWRETREARQVEFIERSYDPAGVTLRPTRDIGRWSVIQGEAKVAAVSVVDHRVVLDVDSSDGVMLAIHVAMFPGWTVRIDDREEPFAVNPGDRFIHVSVPQGRHTVATVFENTAIRRAGNTISVISLVLVALTAVCAALGASRTLSQ
jgi:hypothetical protein